MPQSLQELVLEYGPLVLIVYVSISLAALCAICAALFAGMDAGPMLQHAGLSTAAAEGVRRAQQQRLNHPTHRSPYIRHVVGRGFCAVEAASAAQAPPHPVHRPAGRGAAGRGGAEARGSNQL